MKKPSPAMQLLSLTWSNVNAASGHSWERVNHAMSHAMGMAICYGFRFAEGDFAEIHKNFRTAYWMKSDYAYRDAVTGGRIGKHVPSGDDLVEPHNMSAVKSIEANGYPCWMLRGFRLFIGAEIKWLERPGDIRAQANPGIYFQKVGLPVKVTSIDSERVVLSHYPNRDARRPTRILKITREILAEQNSYFAPTKKAKGKEGA